MNDRLNMNKDQWLSVCSDVVYRHDRERMMCVSVAPIEKRELLLALLAFNHEISIIPELVSESLIGEIRLQWWRDTINAIYEGVLPDHPVALGLAWAIKKCELSQNLFKQYLAARSLDLLKTPPATLAMLEDYALKTSGILHELMAEVLLVKPDLKIRLAARNAGAAWALAGLLVAIPFHSSHGRSYLPADLPEDARIIVVSKAAERYVCEARCAHSYVPHSLLPAMLPITLVEFVLRKLERCGFDPSEPRLQHLGIGRLFGFYWKIIRKRY